MRAGEKKKYSHIMLGHSQSEIFTAQSSIFVLNAFHRYFLVDFSVLLNDLSNHIWTTGKLYHSWHTTTRSSNISICVAGNSTSFCFSWTTLPASCVRCSSVLYWVRKKQSFHVHVLRTIHDLIWVSVTLPHRFLVFSRSPRLYSLLGKPFRLLNDFVSFIDSF